MSVIYFKTVKAVSNLLELIEILKLVTSSFSSHVYTLVFFSKLYFFFILDSLQLPLQPCDSFGNFVNYSGKQTWRLSVLWTCEVVYKYKLFSQKSRSRWFNSLNNSRRKSGAQNMGRNWRLRKKKKVAKGRPYPINLSSRPIFLVCSEVVPPLPPTLWFHSSGLLHPCEASLILCFLSLDAHYLPIRWVQKPLRSPFIRWGISHVINFYCKVLCFP